MTTQLIITNMVRDENNSLEIETLLSGNGDIVDRVPNNAFTEKEVEVWFAVPVTRLIARFDEATGNTIITLLSE